MKHNDTQSGSPEIIYKDTKTNVEAIAAPVEGMKAYATDTHLEGNYNGTAWKWIGPSALLGNGASQYQTLITGATPFVPVYSGFLLDGTTGGKTVLAVTSGKVLTLTAVDNFNLTVPATGTAALLNQANIFTLINPLTTISESWIGPSSTTGIYFKGGFVGIGTTTPAHYFDVTKTVNLRTAYGANVVMGASTLQSDAASTGNDETLDGQYHAFPFTASASHTVGSWAVRLKIVGTVTNTTDYIRLKIYSDNAGVPNTLLLTTDAVRMGSLTTAYVSYLFGGDLTLVNGTAYWIAVERSAVVAGGGSIAVDRNATALTSTNVAAPVSGDWTVNAGLARYILYGQSPRAGYFLSTNSYGVYGISTNNIGVLGISTNNIGVQGISTNSIGVYGISTNNIGVLGISTNSYGVYGISTNSYGVYGISTTNRAGYFYRNNVAGTATAAVLDIVQDSATSETNTVLRLQGDGTGDLVNIFDATTELFTMLDGGNVGLGITAPTAKLHVVGNADTQQLIIKANATQTQNIVEIQNSSATILTHVNSDGTLDIGIATGTAPLVVASTTVVANLNADLHDGLHSTDIPNIKQNISITARTTAIGSTNITGTNTAGLYRVSYYLEDTTADLTAGTIQVTFGWTDDAGATTSSSVALPLTAVSRTSGMIYVRVLGTGSIQYLTTLVGVIGTSQYALFASCEKLL